MYVCKAVIRSQVSDGVHVPVAVGVLHDRGVRGEGRHRAVLHGDCRRHLVCYRVLFKVRTLLPNLILLIRINKTFHKGYLNEPISR